MTRAGPILLVGPQRSGTTALAAALSNAFAAQSGCFTINGKLPYLLRRWWTEEDAAAGHLRADEVTHALGRIDPQGVGSAAWLARARAAVVRSARRAACGDTTGSVAAEIRRVCAESYGDGPWGDKYNEYLLELPWLHATFPDARWAFLVREPHESVASMLAWRHYKVWNPNGAAAASAKWAHWVSRWLAFREVLPQHRRVELDYGELCEGRHEALSELVGADLSPFLQGFRRRSHAPVSPTLCPRAHAMRGALVRLGILRGHGRRQTSQQGEHHA